VGERPHGARAITRDDHGHAREVHREVVARVRDALDAAHVDPRLGEDPLDLALVEALGGVAPARQALGHVLGAPHGVVVLRAEQVDRLAHGSLLTSRSAALARWRATGGPG